MTQKQLIFGGLAIVIALVLYLTFSIGNNSEQDSLNPEAYAQTIDTERSQKNNFFKTNSESPIVDKSNFTGLSYFPANLSYRLTARLEPFADKTQKMVVKLSDGSEEVYEKFGHAVFSLDGEVYRLLVVKQNGTISILFKDATSNQETYGGGRYLDIAPESIQGNQLILDFNLAYNPYCAYNHSYACPLPPDENTLPIPIRAGERYVAQE